MPTRLLILGQDNPILRQSSKPVVKIDTKIKNLVKDLKDTVKEHKGLGLAAPQIGHNLRVMVVNLNHGTEQAIQLPMVNPKVTFFSDTKSIAEEGCLSLPGIYVNVERSTNIMVEFLTAENQKQTLHLKDLNARIVQHEVDHLDGVLIVDKAVKGVTLPINDQ